MSDCSRWAFHGGSIWKLRAVRLQGLGDLTFQDSSYHLSLVTGNRCRRRIRQIRRQFERFLDNLWELARLPELSSSPDTVNGSGHVRSCFLFYQYLTCSLLLPPLSLSLSLHLSVSFHWLLTISWFPLSLVAIWTNKKRIKKSNLVLILTHHIHPNSVARKVEEIDIKRGLEKKFLLEERDETWHQNRTWSMSIWASIYDLTTYLNFWNTTTYLSYIRKPISSSQPSGFWLSHLSSDWNWQYDITNLNLIPPRSNI